MYGAPVHTYGGPTTLKSKKCLKLIVVLTFVDTNNKLGQDKYSAPLIICHVSDVITMYCSPVLHECLI